MLALYLSLIMFTDITGELPSKYPTSKRTNKGFSVEVVSAIF